MTDKPTTLAIDQTEWRVLFASNIARLNEFVNATQALTAENLAALHEHLDRSKLLATAWHRSTPPATQAAPDAAAIQARAEAGKATQTNGAAPKGRGGWPKGKSRKQPAQAVQ